MTVKKYYALSETGMKTKIFDEPNGFKEAKAYLVDVLENEQYEAEFDENEKLAMKYSDLSDNVYGHKKPFNTSEINGTTYSVAGPFEYESELSYTGCECCNDGLIADTYPVEGYSEKQKCIIDLGRVCHDCLCEWYNGE